MYGLWDENSLSLGLPACMDTPTLIEWIQRQLETKEKTAERHGILREEHAAWHATTPGIYACCMLIRAPVLTPNEARQIREKVGTHDGKMIVLDEGMTVTPHPDLNPEATYFTRRPDGR